APFGPRRDVTCPGASARSTASRAMTFPNLFVTPRSSATGVAAVRAAAVLLRFTLIATSTATALIATSAVAADPVFETPPATRGSSVDGPRRASAVRQQSEVTDVMGGRELGAAEPGSRSDSVQNRPLPSRGR